MSAGLEGVLARHLFTLYPGQIACDCEWAAEDDDTRAGEGRMIATHVAHVAAEVRAWLSDQFVLAEVEAEDAVLETMSLGTSGRYIADYGQTPDSIARVALGVVRGRLAGEGEA